MEKSQLLHAKAQELVSPIPPRAKASGVIGKHTVRKLVTKRGYFVNSTDEPSGFAVVATSVKEAKQIAYKSGELCVDAIDVRWIDIRVHQKRDADVSMLPIGMVGDARVGLLCGLYGFLEEYPCDMCGKDRDCHAYGGKVLCECCLEKAKENK